MFRRVKEIVEDLSPYVFAIPGNEDPDEVREVMKKLDFDFHGKAAMVEDVKFIGFEGARWIETGEGVFVSYDPVHEFLKDKRGKKVLITHVPPFDTETDKLWTGHHVGSPFLRSLIEDYQPDLVICGHVHEARGVDRIGKTTIVNTGCLADGYAAWIELKREPEVTFLKIEKKGIKKIPVLKVKKLERR